MRPRTLHELQELWGRRSSRGRPIAAVVAGQELTQSIHPCASGPLGRSADRPSSHGVSDDPAEQAGRFGHTGDEATARSVAVIVPFYQKTAGVLPKALSSIFGQQLPPEWTADVIVVDDASPVPASSEIASLAPEDAARVRCIRRVNGGPAAARNTGLDAIVGDCRYIAFLDSDDRWSADHLATAIMALEEGADVYFSNNWFESQKDWFSEHPNFRRFISEQVGGGGTIDASIMLSTALALELLIEEPLIHPSTLVISRSHHGPVRFDEALVSGEDHLYAMVLADRAKRIQVRLAPSVTRGSDGLNFYRGSLDWNSPRASWRAMTNAAKYGVMARTLDHRSEIVAIARAKAKVVRQEAVYLFVRNALRFPCAQIETAREAWKLARWSCFQAIPIGFEVLKRRWKGELDFRV